MALTSGQLTILKSDIDLNHPTEVTNGDAGALQLIYNAIRSPDFWVFKTSVSTDAAREAIDWTEVFSVTTPLPGISQWGFDILVASGTFDPSLENTRDGFVQIFPGSEYSNTRSSLLLASTELATVGEQLYATSATGPGGGDGSLPTLSALKVVSGSISLQDFRNALALS